MSEFHFIHIHRNLALQCVQAKTRFGFKDQRRGLPEQLEENFQNE